MRYSYKELCSSTLDLFEYHRAEQLEFDFLQQQLVTAFEMDTEYLTHCIKSEEVRTLASFQDHARYMTSCFYTKIIKNHKIAVCERYSTEEQFSALYNCYLEMKDNNLLIGIHIDGLENYLIRLESFCDTTSA